MNMDRRPAHADIHRDVFAFHVPRGQSADTLRAALARIELNDTPVRRLAVVGCMAGSGRSFVAANLAVLLAQSGQRTALIDAARARPRQHLLFGLSSIDTASTATTVPRLTVVTGTETQPSLADTLIEAPAQFAQAMTELGRKYEYILIDTSAHPSDLDAISAGNLSDGALLIVQRGITPVHRLRTLTDRLRESGTRVLGTLLIEE